MAAVRRVLLGGRLWRIVRYKRRGAQCVGYCSGRTIGIAAGLSGPNLLDTVLHEGLHASCPWLDEEAVHRVAGELTELVRAVGVLT